MNLSTVSEVSITSREFSELSGRRHSDILESIRTLNRDFIEMNKTEAPLSEYIDKTGRTLPQFILTKYHCELLAMRMDTKTQIKVLDRLKDLEKEISKPKTLEEQMRDVILLADKRIQELEEEKALNAPKVQFAEAISGSATAVSVGDWIKAVNDSGKLKMGRNKAFKWFRDNGYLMKTNRPYQRYIEQELFEVREGLVVTSKGQMPTFTTLISGKGQMYFLDKIK